MNDTQTSGDRPKMLADPAVRAERLKQLNMPHIAPLTQFVTQLRGQMGSEAHIPDFDPWDGGVDAEILFLLEAPGPKAKSSGFVSRNNPDETAKNLFELTQSAQIPRQQVVVWNVVPWYIGKENGRIRPAMSGDFASAASALNALLLLLKQVNTIVFMGKKAARVKADIELWHPGKYRFVETPHPSPMCLNRSKSRRNLIVDEFQKIAKPH